MGHKVKGEISTLDLHNSNLVMNIDSPAETRKLVAAGFSLRKSLL